MKTNFRTQQQVIYSEALRKSIEKSTIITRISPILFNEFKTKIVLC